MTKDRRITSTLSDWQNVEKSLASNMIMSLFFTFNIIVRMVERI